MNTALVTGGTGFIGEALIPALQQRGYRVLLLTRKPDAARQRYPEAQPFRDWRELGDLCPEVVINLAGEGIADKRWTDARKQVLRESRIGVTRSLVDWCATRQTAPRVMVSGSAIGYYGDCGDEWVDEHSPAGHDFAARLCSEWESAARPVRVLGTRLAIVRIGLVMGPGGMLKRLLLPFRLGLGGRLGPGTQWMSWIERGDLVRLILALTDSHEAEGIFNAVAPNPVTNEDFTRVLARALKRPAMLPVPAWLLRTLMGELAELLLASQRVRASRMEWLPGFRFRFTGIEKAITHHLPQLTGNAKVQL